jgi:hypothetical protein
VCTPRLFVCDNVGQVLQHPVRGYGKDAGHRLFVRTRWLQGQNDLVKNVFSGWRTSPLSAGRCRITLVNIRRTIAVIVLALLPLASSMPAMCDQCQFGTASPNYDASHSKSFASPQASPTVTTGQHCQHMASSQPWSASHLVSTGPCQDNPCKQALDSVTKLSRSDFAQPPTSFRFIVIAEISGDHRLFSKGTPRSSDERPRFSPSAYQSLCASLRI